MSEQPYVTNPEAIDIREQNYERLVQLAIEQSPAWDWTACCVCGEISTHAGIVLNPLAATLGRIGWCDRRECREDMAGTKVALPTTDATIAHPTATENDAPACERAAESDVARVVGRDLSPAARNLARSEGWADHARMHLATAADFEARVTPPAQTTGSEDPA